MRGAGRDASGGRGRAAGAATGLAGAAAAGAACGRGCAHGRSRGKTDRVIVGLSDFFAARGRHDHRHVARSDRHDLDTTGDTAV